MILDDNFHLENFLCSLVIADSRIRCHPGGTESPNAAAFRPTEHPNTITGFMYECVYVCAGGGGALLTPTSTPSLEVQYKKHYSRSAEWESKTDLQSRRRYRQDCADSAVLHPRSHALHCAPVGR